jgi:hypothetical protein
MKTDLAIAHHESGHAVIASLFNIPYRAVSVTKRDDGNLGRITTKPAELGMMMSDPIDGTWGLQAFAMVSLAGPLAEARWAGEPFDPPWLYGINLEHEYGGRVDVSSARLFAEEAEVPFEDLLRDTARMLDEDKVWLAVERVADRLVERRILGSTEVGQLIGKKAR